MVTTTPDENETKSIIQNTGTMLGSKTSFQPILNSLNENFDFIDFGKVSFIRIKINMERSANREEIQNISRRPISLAR